MPNRLIREGLLDSQRYWSVTTEARQLFVHLMLLADDFGCVSIAPAFVRRRCFDDSPSIEKVTALFGQLVDHDLIRIYESGGARYGFVPRFGQRLQRLTLKHPKPPSALIADDRDAVEKFSRINRKSEWPTDGQRLGNGELTDGQPPEVEAEVEVEVEANKTLPFSRNREKGFGNVVAERPARLAGKQTVPDCPHDQIVDAFHELLPSLPRVEVWDGERQSHLRARWRECAARGVYRTREDGIAYFRQFFEHVGKSRFLTGEVCRNGRQAFLATLPWLVKPQNFAKVIEGNYDV